ncbi:hypothetical protein EV426DRAFT_172793 [Tirmania nivea]|nr:hypothetical protein EV426DRAFT_172793 [Tirmania nivea]
MGARMDERSDMSQLSTKFALARLRHEVGELESQVAQDRKLIPPSRKVFHCVVDDTALTSAIAEFKRWIQDGAVVVTVPLCTLDGLDQCKKGTDDININSREAIRYFDRIQNGSLSVRGLSFQNPTEKFETWKQAEEYMIPGAIPPGRQQRSPTIRPIRPITPVNPTTPIDSSGLSPQPRSPTVARQNGNGNGNTHVHANGYGGMKSMNGNKGRSNTFPLQQNGRRNTNCISEDFTLATVEPPRRIQQLLNCVLYRKHKAGKRDTSPPSHQQLAMRPEIHLITNSLEVTAWARVFDISVLSSNVLEDMIEREDFIYAEKLKDYQEAHLHVEGSRGRGGRGGGSGRGGNRSSGNGGGGGRNNHGHGHGHPTNGGSGGGRGHRGGGGGEPDFVFVREAPRGVARGKGKLWEP